MTYRLRNRAIAGCILCCAIILPGAFMPSVPDALSVRDTAHRLLADEPSGQSDVDLSRYYGFGPLEIFKLDQRSANMLARDMNGDGLTDLVLVDNSHSRIDLLEQRPSPPTPLPEGEGNGVRAVPEVSQERSVNEVGSDWRFVHRKIPVDKEISAMAVGDFNGDGRSDIAYFGTPDRLMIRLQSEAGRWDDVTGFRLPDVPPAPWSVAAGDLNGDGKQDLAVLGEHETFLVYQQSDGTLAAPQTIMNTSDKLGLLQIADLDGDGRNDLCYLAQEGQRSQSGPDRSFCARLQQSDGRLGPEIRFALNKPRGVSLFNVDGKPGDEVLAIDSRTGRVNVLQLHRPQAKPDELAGQLIEYGFGRGGLRRDRDLATGDLDGDGLTDVVVTDPETAQMIVFRQRPLTPRPSPSGRGEGSKVAAEGAGPRGRLDLGTPFPGLVGAEQVRISDVDRDGIAEVLVLSKQEKTIGLSRLKDGRLTFPQALPVHNEPAAFELADLDGDGTQEIVYLSQKREDRSSQYSLQALRWEPSPPSPLPGGEGGTGEGWQPVAFGKQQEVPLQIGGEPRQMIRLDANRDGRPDFLVFPGLDRPPSLFAMNDDGIPREVTTQGGIGLADVTAGAVFVGRLDGPVLLVAQRNFARNMRLDEDRHWQVLDQYNAPESDARIVGVATIDLDGKPGNEIVLVDSGIGKLRVLRQDENLFRPWQEVDIGNFPYKSTHVADLNGDGRDDLVLFGLGKFAVLYAGQTSPVLKDVATFETKLKDTYFADVAAGDVNGDGRPDLAVIDTRSHFVEILRFAPIQSPPDQAAHRRGNPSAANPAETQASRAPSAAGWSLEHAMHFKVFEEKSFRGTDGPGSQPREAVIADVTNDGLADLILLTHDRVLVYPQDDIH